MSEGHEVTTIDNSSADTLIKEDASVVVIKVEAEVGEEHDPSSENEGGDERTMVSTRPTYR
jgi:hypothetical protein